MPENIETKSPGICLAFFLGCYPMGKKKQSKELALLESIKFAVKPYKEKLVGKKYLFVFDGRFLEVIFKAENFKHLAGVESPLSKRGFYKAAVSRTLNLKQLRFTNQHPFDYAQRKAAHLAEISSLVSEQSTILETVSLGPRMYRLGSTNHSFSVLFEEDHVKGEPRGYYVPYSLRDEDVTAHSENSCDVTHVFEKASHERFYTKLTFLRDGHTLDELPQDIRDRLALS
ncbi:MAG: hypothetical protein IJ230_03740 [Clostridia bacterium]|nr:hypothetical protein [Clostridia bacterium]